MRYTIAKSMPSTVTIRGADLPVRWFFDCARKCHLIHNQVDVRGSIDLTDVVLEAILTGIRRSSGTSEPGEGDWSQMPAAYRYGCVRNLVRDAARKHRRLSRSASEGS